MMTYEEQWKRLLFTLGLLDQMGREGKIEYAPIITDQLRSEFAALVNTGFRASAADMDKCVKAIMDEMFSRCRW
jgi:hypothetical protein